MAARARLKDENIKEKSRSPFVVVYFNASGLTPIQLTPNSWAYLLRFTKYAKQILREESSVVCFGQCS